MDKWFVKRYRRFFEEAKKRVPDEAQVVIIGANDGVARDPSRQVWRDGWRGLFIEPNSQAVKRLETNINPDQDSIIQVAIAEESGYMHLWMMTPKAAQAFEKVKKDHGSCLTSTNREHIVSRVQKNLPSLVKKQGMDALVMRVHLPCAALRSILNISEISRVNLVQIDTEGMDLIMVRQVCKCMTTIGIRPDLILYEHRHLSVQDRERAVISLQDHGYIVEPLHNDSIAFPK